ncbi:MAG: hypothetical protein QOF01_2474 [Thermomicrobiales bacterium]|nr:hypothetical protein [Thermomicrobiales bacterium]
MSETTQSAASPTRILVPLDGSYLAEQAIPYAAALVGGGGELVFFHVAPDPEPIRSLSGEIKTPAEEVDQIEHAETQVALRDTASRWGSVLSTAPRYEVTTGDPAEEILAATEGLGCGLIVMASRGRGALARLAFGSVADRVARSSVVPVLMVRPVGDEQEVHPIEIRRVLVPLDGSPLAAEALPVATAIATQLRVPVHLLQAINPSALVMPVPVGVDGFSAEVYTEIEDELTTAARTNLDEAAREVEAGGVAVTTVVTEGPPVTAIEDATESGDLIVMSSHGRSGVRRWLLGSTAEKLIRTGPAPVLLVPASSRTEAASR